jgi:YgiT-type zinc finger domain-containing protein
MKGMVMAIKTCPTCNQQHVERKRTTVTLQVRGRSYQISDVEVEVCPDCGETLFDLEASRRVEEVVYAKRRVGKRTAV